MFGTVIITAVFKKKVQKCDVRWKSIHKMVSSVIEQMDQVNSTLKHLYESKICISTEYEDFLTQECVLLFLEEDAANELQSENFVANEKVITIVKQLERRNKSMAISAAALTVDSFKKRFQISRKA